MRRWAAEIHAREEEQRQQYEQEKRKRIERKEECERALAGSKTIVALFALGACLLGVVSFECERVWEKVLVGVQAVAMGGYALTIESLRRDNKRALKKLTEREKERE